MKLLLKSHIEYKIIIIFFITYFNSINLMSQSDSCLCLLINNESFSNPDSVKVDTCRNSSTYKKLYGKKYIIIFNRNAYPLDVKPAIKNAKY